MLGFEPSVISQVQLCDCGQGLFELDFEPPEEQYIVFIRLSVYSCRFIVHSNLQFNSF